MLSHIQRVEIELHSKCNRHCEWCFNCEYKRDEYVEMEEWLFLKILNELKENNYDYQSNKLHTKLMTYNRFCEPTYNKDLLIKRVRQTKEILPRILSVFGTNGDYLTPEFLEEITFLHAIYISDYDNKGKEYWLERFKELKILVSNHGDRTIYGTHRKINKVSCKIDWPKNIPIEDRAGFLDKDIIIDDAPMHWKHDKEVRTARCIEPKYYISIDYNGNIVPCCHMRSDIPRYKKYVWGNVKDNTILEIYNSPKAVAFRKRVFEDLDFPDICKTCTKHRLGFNWNWIDPGNDPERVS